MFPALFVIFRKHTSLAAPQYEVARGDVVEGSLARGDEEEVTPE